MSRIRLIGTVNIPPISGHDGHIIEVTAENQDVAESLVLCGSARTLKEVDDVILQSTGPQLEKLSSDQIPQGVLDASSNGQKLLASDPIARLADFGIHNRYRKALTDAGCVTIADVVSKSSTLAEIPGISDAAAKAIALVLKDEIEEG